MNADYLKNTDENLKNAFDLLIENVEDEIEGLIAEFTDDELSENIKLDSISQIIEIQTELLSFVQRMQSRRLAMYNWDNEEVASPQKRKKGLGRGLDSLFKDT